MEARLQRLEDDVSAIKADVAALRRSEYATKADLDDCSKRLVKWIVGTGLATGIVITATMVFEARHILAEGPAVAPAPTIVIIAYHCSPAKNKNGAGKKVARSSFF